MKFPINFHKRSQVLPKSFRKKQRPRPMQRRFLIIWTTKTLTIEAAGATADAPATLPLDDTPTWVLNFTVASGIQAGNLPEIKTVQIKGHIQIAETAQNGFAPSNGSGWESLKHFVVVKDGDSSLTFAQNAKCKTMFGLLPDDGSAVVAPLETVEGNISFNNVRDSSGLFANCVNLQELPDSFDVPNSEDCDYMFQHCEKLQALPSFTAAGAQGASCAFDGCQALKELPSLAANGLGQAVGMFRKCVALESLPEDFNPKDLISTAMMFMGCSSLKTITLSKLENLQYVYLMFCGCSKLTDISTLSSWKVDVVNLDGMGFIGMFAGCTSLPDVSPLAAWEIDETNNMEVDFGEGLVLTGLTGMCGTLNKEVANMFIEREDQKYQSDLPAPSLITKMSFGEGWGKMNSKALLSMNVWQPTEEALNLQAAGESLPWYCEDKPEQGPYETTNVLFSAFDQDGGWTQGTWVAQANPEPDVNPSGNDGAGALPATGDLLGFGSFFVAGILLLGARLTIAKGCKKGWEI